MLAENLECALLNDGAAIERQHQAGHQGRTQRQAPVGGLVTDEGIDA